MSIPGLGNFDSGDLEADLGINLARFARGLAFRQIRGIRIIFDIRFGIVTLVIAIIVIVDGGVDARNTRHTCYTCFTSQT